MADGEIALIADFVHLPMAFYLFGLLITANCPNCKCERAIAILINKRMLLVEKISIQVTNWIYFDTRVQKLSNTFVVSFLVFRTKCYHYF